MIQTALRSGCCWHEYIRLRGNSWGCHNRLRSILTALRSGHGGLFWLHMLLRERRLGIEPLLLGSSRHNGLRSSSSVWQWRCSRSSTCGGRCADLNWRRGGKDARCTLYVHLHLRMDDAYMPTKPLHAGVFTHLLDVTSFITRQLR